MFYYADRRYTIIENPNGTYDIYDGKYGKSKTRKGQTKEWTDNFIQQRKNRPNASRLDREVNKHISAYSSISVKRAENLEKAALVTKLFELEDFSKYKYPWLSRVIQLSLEYLILEGLPDSFRSSQIPDEILDICSEELYFKQDH